MRTPKNPGPCRKMTPEECAYIGGLFDGEGTVHSHAGYKPMHLTLSNTDVELISVLLRITQVGTCCSIRSRQPHHIQQYRWSLNAIEHVRDFVQQVLPYSVKLRSKFISPCYNESTNPVPTQQPEGEPLAL